MNIGICVYLPCIDEDLLWQLFFLGHLVNCQKSPQLHSVEFWSWICSQLQLPFDLSYLSAIPGTSGAPWCFKPAKIQDFWRSFMFIPISLDGSKGILARFDLDERFLPCAFWSFTRIPIAIKLRNPRCQVCLKPESLGLNFWCGVFSIYKTFWIPPI